MKSSSQLLYTIIGFFVIFGIVVSMNSKTAFAEDGKVFYLDDLKVGDFIPNDSTLIVGDVYVNSCGVISNKVRIYYGYMEYYELDVGGVYTIDTPDEYDGLVVTNIVIDYTHQVKIEFTNLDEIDNDSNVVFNEVDNEMQLTCKNNVEPTYNWYKLKRVDDIQINAPNKSLWKKENGVYSYSLIDYEASSELTSEIKLKIDAKKDDLLSFDYKTAYYNLNYSLNNVNYSLFSGRRNGYNNARIKMMNSGENEIVLYDLMTKYDWNGNNSYIYNDYFSLKNISILTPLNEGSKLDTSKVSNGDEIYYECKCNSGYKYSNSFRYGEEESVVEDETTEKDVAKNKVDNNPPTYSDVIYVLFIIFVIGFSTYINREKIFRKDS